MGEPISHKHKSEFSSQILKWVNGVVGHTMNVEDEAPKKTKFSLWKK
jgi:hypothetical protein